MENYFKKIKRDKKAKMLYYKVNDQTSVKNPEKWVENQYQLRYFFELTSFSWPKDDFYFYYEYMYQITDNEFSVPIECLMNSF